MKKKLWYTLLTVALIVVLAASLSVGALADDPEPTPDPGEVSQDGMTMAKHVTVQENGTFIVDLDAFATGKVTTTVSTTPCDIVLVLDVSGSMDEHLYSYTPRERQSYSYNSYGNNEYYYLHTDGNYYRVYREGNNSRRLRFRVGNTDWYLNADGNAYTYYTSGQNANATLYTGVLYTRTDDGTKLAALKTAVNGFLDIVAQKNAAPEAVEKSRVAIVKFAGARFPSNTSDQSSPNATTASQYQSYIGNQRYGSYNYNYTQVMRDLAIVDSTSLGTATDNYASGTFKGAVNAINAGGATSADFGMAYANAIFDKYPIAADSDRQQIVVMFTDGEPNHSSGFNGTVANSAITYAKGLKANGAKVFSVAVLAGADPTDTSSQINGYLHGVSSNYPDATAWNSLGTRYEVDGVKPDFYYTAANSSQLSGIFAAIANSTGDPGTTIGTEAVLKDIVSSSFTLPDGATEDDIHVSIVRWNSYQHRWGISTDTDGGEKYVFTPEEWATYTAEKYTTTEDGQTVDGTETVEVNITGPDVDVTGFNYGKHYKATKPSEDNAAIDKPNGVNKDTAKIVISFEIDAKPSAVTGGSVATNGENSGLYVDGELLIKFPQPTVVFTPVTYVVDYVTSDTSTDTKASTVKLDYASVLNNVEMLDDPSDDVLIGEQALDFDYTIYKGKYGTISFGDDATDVQRRYVRYAPTTMNWDGYDRIFIKGESKTEDDKDVWAMLAVIPANSVFYEDTYITQTKTVEYNNETVTIEYTGIGYTGAWDTVGTEGKNQTYHAGDDMGWISGLADDSTYANDMAHTANTAKAKATFTFSGTGVDIYSRTNGSTGTVLVTIKSNAADNVSGQKITKSMLIDTKAAAGDFFAIPVCTFTDLSYGKYTVTITVTTGGAAEGRMTFYLDGVRVYNPIQPLEDDENVQLMYTEKNLGAVFTEVRGMLGTSGIHEAAALYIDEHTVSDTVTDVDAVEAAAKALADAQLARDAYIEANITPAKNAISEAEYALESANSKVESTKNIYDVAKKAYDDAVAAGETELTELENAMNTAKTNWDNAKDDAEAAQDKYDEEIGGLQQALADAVSGQSTYDDAVDAARVAYDTANNAVELAYTTTNVVADYNKDGPNSEIYLDHGQQIAINVESGKTYYIGLKSLKGDEVSVLLNGSKTVKLSHTTDLYYEVTPASGSNIIVIKNNNTEGNAILSVTKLRTTGVDNTESGAKVISTEQLFQAFKALYAAPATVTEYSGDVLTEDEATTVDPVDVTPTEPADPVTEIELGEDDITIEPADPAIEVVDPEPAAEPSAQSAAVSSLSRLLESFFGFFRR